MYQLKKNIAVSAYILVIIVLINAIIIKSAYVSNQGLYWLLILSIPVLFLAIDYANEKRKIFFSKGADKKLNIENGKIHKSNSSFLSNKNKEEELTVLFGNSYCAQPYISSIVCYEAINANRNSNFTHKQTGSSKNNNFLQQPVEDDIIWQIGPGYQGCSNEKFNFNAELFRLKATQSFVKMIELKLAKAAIANDVLTKKDIYSNAAVNKYPLISLQKITAHTSFSNAESMVLFLDSLRQLSGKKPVGIRLCITDKKELHEICYAFRKTGIIPDYIVVESCEAQENSLLNSSSASGMHLYEALLFVSKTLEMYGMEKEIKIIAASEIHSPFDVLRLFALGADAVSLQHYSTRSENNYETDDTASTAFSKICMEQLRNKILDSTKNIVQALGYSGVRDITLSSFFRDLDVLYSKGFYRRYNQWLGKSYEESPISIIKKTYHGEHAGSKVIFN